MVIYLNNTSRDFSVYCENNTSLVSNYRIRLLQGTEELSQRACFWDYDTIKCKPANSSEDMRYDISFVYYTSKINKI